MDNELHLLDIMNKIPESFQLLMNQYDDAIGLIKSQSKQFAQINERLEFMEKQQPVNPVIISFLFHQRKKIIINLLGGKESPAYKDKQLTSSVYREAANDFKKHFKIPRYDMLRKEDQESALKFWHNWSPSLNLQNRIDRINGL